MDFKKYFNKKYVSIGFHVIVVAVIIYALKIVVDNSNNIMNEVADKVSWLFQVIKPVILGFVFAYLMDPIINFFEQRYRGIKPRKFFKKLRAPRTWATVTALLLLICAVTGLGILLVFSLTDQLRLANFDDILLLSESYIDYIDDIYRSVLAKLQDLNIQSDELEQYVNQATTFVLNTVKSVATSAIVSVGNVSGYFTTIIFTIIIGIYFMIDGGMIMTYIKKVCRALFPEKVGKKANSIIHDLDHVFSGYIRGQLADAAVMMILISVTLSITGVKLAIVIGVFSGLANLIPYFGPIIAYVSTTVVCLINGDTRIWVISMILLLLIQAIDGNIIGPKLMSRSIQIHPLIIIISLIFGSSIGGLLGMLFAVPVGAYLKLVFVRFVDQKLEEKDEKEALEMKKSQKTTYK